MLGYMTKNEAIENGFTHHGSYYGIPLWLAPDNPNFPVATKWMPFEYLMTLFHVIEGFCWQILYPHEPPAFKFDIGMPIE